MSNKQLLIKVPEQVIYQFVLYVWDDAMSDFRISFKDGDPQETFYNYFNSYFDKDQMFESFLL